MCFYTGLWLNQASSPVCWDDIVTAGSPVRCSGWKGERSRGCDGGIMEFLTGQRQTIDPQWALYVSLSSTTAPTAHQQSIRPGKEEWSGPGFTAAASFFLLTNPWPKAQRRISQKSQTFCLTRSGGYILNKWLAAEHISLPYHQCSCLSHVLYFPIHFHFNVWILI